MATEVQATEYDYDALGSNAGPVRGLVKSLKTRMRKAAESILEIGSELIALKALTKHGGTMKRYRASQKNGHWRIVDNEGFVHSRQPDETTAKKKAAGLNRHEELVAAKRGAK